jgi:hypothetical protein
MNKEVPEGFSAEVRDAMVPIRDAMVAAGWTFDAIHWDNRSAGDRKLVFSAKSPTGASVYTACHESSVVAILQALLDRRDDTVWR